ncbi:hypothetical protein [Sphingobacterium arenae]|uniref:PKD domain-containing protein n=1 Tax=Sphingobacterium arenae TaxID=1280598 RepID=A0ABR7Y4G2_9SPHI|nr:hypothetical protein [Sphingobacterium arenae]MBD1426198.1 hypothetical protein [Sphingobacterium arenae]
MQLIRLKIRYIISCVMMMFFAACGEEETFPITLFEPGKIAADASGVDIKFGEYIIYTDRSTKVQSRNWAFPGGTPGTSTDSVVTVYYPLGGSFKAILNVVFIDNQRGQHAFDIEVEPDPNNQIPDYDYGVTYGIYTEHPDIISRLALVRSVDMNHFPGIRVSDAFEGVEAYKFGATGESDWAMGALEDGRGQYIDISSFENGYYHIGLKSSSLAPMLIRIRSAGGGNAVFEFTASGEEYGFKRDGNWHLVSIPVAHIKQKDPNINLAQITEFILFRSGSGDVRTFDNYTFFVDHVFVSEKMEEK